MLPPSDLEQVPVTDSKVESIIQKPPDEEQNDFFKP